MNLQKVSNDDGTVDLVGKQGGTWVLSVTLTGAEGALDLTGWSARSQIRKTFSSETIEASWTCTIPSPALGTVNMVLAASTTAGLSACSGPVSVVTRGLADAAGMYVYDLEIYRGSPEEVSRVIGGKLYVDPEVTR